MKLPFFKVEYIKIPIFNFSDYFTTITLSYWQHNIKKLEWLYFLNERKNISNMPTGHPIQQQNQWLFCYQDLVL